MISVVTRRTALIGLSAFAALPVHAQPSQANKSKPETLEFAVFEKPAVFEIAPISGSLKETIQKGQELIWHRKEKQDDRIFQIDKLSVGLLRSETGGQLMMTFSCSISSLGYTLSEEAKLHVIFRTKGGAALHTAVVGVLVKCTDKDRTLHPQTDEIPVNVAANVFTNVSSVEITEHSEPNFPGLKVQRCGS